MSSPETPETPEEALQDAFHDAELLDDDEDGDELTDIPMDTADHGSSLPTAEELRLSLPPTRKGCSKKVWGFALLAVVLIALIAGLASGGGQRSQANNVNEPAARQASLSEVVDYLVATGVSSRESLTAGGSPQSMAANWLANLDGKNLKLPIGGGSSKEGYKYVSRYVLALLWYGLNGSSWLNHYGFLSSNDECYWNSPVPISSSVGIDFVPGGAYCDRDSLKVTAIHLDFNGLKGVIPSELGFLTSLQLVALDGNEMRGGFITSLCKLENIKALTLAHNDMIGTLPPCMSGLTDLEILMLSNNYFRDGLPDFTKLTKMKTLLLDDNDFTGTVTSTFNKMSNLEYLFLEENAFYGKIDHSFLNGLNKLRRLDLSECNFIGQVPTHFFTMSQLELIDLHGNRLAGSLPSTIHRNTALRYLALHDNFIGGELHPNLMNLTELFHLDLSNNTLKGDFPARLGQMKLEYLFLANNNFTAGTIPSAFASLHNLTELSLKGTQRNGTLPAWIGQNLTKLKLLDLDNNVLHGSIPTEFGRLTNLEFLLLNRNSRISGSMPTQLSKLSSLRTVFLDRTSLSGDFSPICSLPNLNEPDDNDADGNEYVIADCGGNNPKVTCTCCDICCSNDDPFCNKNTAISSLNPEWETQFQRVVYSFGNDTNFADRIFSGNP